MLSQQPTIVSAGDCSDLATSPCPSPAMPEKISNDVTTSELPMSDVESKNSMPALESLPGEKTTSLHIKTICVDATSYPGDGVEATSYSYDDHMLQHGAAFFLCLALFWLVCTRSICSRG